MSETTPRRGALIAAWMLLAACANNPTPPRFGQIANPGPLETSPAPGSGTATREGPAAGNSQSESSMALPASTKPLGDSLAQAPLARIGDRELTLGELMQLLYYREGDALRAQFNLAVGAKLADLEGARLALKLEPEAIERRTNEVLGEFARKNVPEGQNFDRFVRERLGFEPLRFKARLRDDTLRELVTERVVRAHSIASEHADVRLLVADEASVDQARQRLIAGEDFVALIKELSRDPSASSGGLIPFLIKDDRAPLSRLAFKTEVGTIGGPLKLPGSGDGGPSLLLRVETRSAPLEGAWSAVGPTVEASLLEVPVSEEEYIAWRVAMEERYSLDLEPFYALLGQGSPAR